MAQTADSTVENKIKIGIALAILAMNAFMARWVFLVNGGDIQEHKWEIFIFNLTCIIPLYLGFSMLISKWCTWLGFPVIFIILAIVEFHQKALDWLYEKCVDAKNYLREKFLECHKRACVTSRV
ncbi:hypothetical protein L1987_76878 [Smallanthus sonchifolius]|uniref:Uncharacterized protein n=1 Tax=Smallanthus sonchifolius TaxID=185202 RepID=A0ACB8Z8M9_9ASTR|nr:hypothetical protein L1987_76878 [Smallanthus sonchifolius]